MQNEAWHCVAVITTDILEKDITVMATYVSKSLIHNSVVGVTLTHMHVIYAMCTDELPYHDRCWLLHLSLVTVWMVHFVFGTKNLTSLSPQKQAE